MSNTITAYTTFKAGAKARSSEVNANFSNHRGDLIPIEENTAAASDLTHDLGTDDHRWKEAKIGVGYWEVGDIKAHHSYNGRVNVGHGWMLCDGRQITEANYNTEHGAGTWATYIGSSTLSSLYLPDFTDNYQVGTNSTTEGGTAAIAEVGNASHQINIAHTHTGPSHTHTVSAHTHSGGSHNHQWYNYVSSGTTSQSYNSGGSGVTITNGALSGGDHIKHYIYSSGGDNINLDLYTSNASGTTGSGGGGSTGSGGTGSTNSQLSSTQSIQPRSVKVQYYMRII